MVAYPGRSLPLRRKARLMCWARTTSTSNLSLCMFAGNPTEDGAMLKVRSLLGGPHFQHHLPYTPVPHLNCAVAQLLRACLPLSQPQRSEPARIRPGQQAIYGALRTVDNKEVKGNSNRNFTRDQVPDTPRTWPCPPRGQPPPPLPPPCINCHGRGLSS